MSRRAPRVPLNPKDLPAKEHEAWRTAVYFANYPAACRAAGYRDLHEFVIRQSEELEQRLQAFEKGATP